VNIAIIENKRELERLEEVISKNLTAFYEVGKALIQIKQREYYIDVLSYDTFEQYCKERWDIARRTAYQYIDSVKVIDNVRHGAHGVECPINERQCRPLAKLEPQQQVKAWEMAVETAPDGKVTARHVSKVVAGLITDERVKKVNKIRSVIDETRVHPDFEKAYRDFYREVQKSKLEGWKDTSKGEALKLVGYIIDLINIE
jgi:hypothetical protein